MGRRWGQRACPGEDGDAGEFVRAVRESVAAVGAWMPWCQGAYSAADARSWFDRCAANLCTAQAYDLGIFSAKGAAFYGGVSIGQINRQHNFGNIGYWVRQSCQRQVLFFTKDGKYVLASLWENDGALTPEAPATKIFDCLHVCL